MFDAALAALAWATRHDDLPVPKTHGGMISSFGRLLVQPGHLSPELGRALNRVHELRLTADYVAEPVPLERAASAVDEAARFLAGIGELLATPWPGSKGR
ncbi:MAG: hypothetical protein J0H99_23085 [Rhodospirillales bacterium]|nr:hypothetical protein [Rhodospirillales bacterium]